MLRLIGYYSVVLGQFRHGMERLFAGVRGSILGASLCDMQVKHVVKESTRVFTTLDTEMTLSTLWDHEGLETVCSSRWREAGEMERSTFLKETIENDVDRLGGGVLPKTCGRTG